MVIPAECEVQYLEPKVAKGWITVLSLAREKQARRYLSLRKESIDDLLTTSFSSLKERELSKKIPKVLDVFRIGDESVTQV